MTSTPLDLILHQSYLHLVSYGLVLATLLVAIADACLLSQLRRALRRDQDRLREEGLAHGVAAPGWPYSKA